MLDACRSFCEIKRVVESADGQTDSPVPPAGGLYFAEELQIRNGIVVILSERFSAPSGAAVCLGGNGFEFDFQRVLSGFEQVSRPCAETGEHVVALSQNGSVQADFRTGVSGVEVQIHRIFRKGIESEFRAEEPLAVADELDGGFIASCIRIGNDSGRIQRGGVVSGQSDGNPDRLIRSVCSEKLPLTL